MSTSHSNSFHSLSIRTYKHSLLQKLRQKEVFLCWSSIDLLCGLNFLTEMILCCVLTFYVMSYTVLTSVTQKLLYCKDNLIFNLKTHIAKTIYHLLAWTPFIPSPNVEKVKLNTTTGKLM